MGYVSMGLFSTTENHLCLYLISLLKELLSLIDANIEVANTNAWCKANALDLDFFGLRALFACLLFFLVFKLAVISKLTYRWHGLWGYLNDIHTALSG